MRAFSIGSRIFPFVKTIAAPVAFLEQITSKDRLTLGRTFTDASTTTQLKIISNIVTGRIAGLTFFHRLSDGTQLPSAPQTLNPAGVINKWTNAGLIGIAYGILGGAINKISRDMGIGSVVPATSKVKSIGKVVLISGGAGGFFDAPAGENGNGNGNGNPNGNFPSLQNAPLLRNSFHRSSHTSSFDSSLSGF